MESVYDAFISYSHHDAAIVERLQQYIEDYALPQEGPLAGRRLKLFRDHTDIATGDLPRRLEDALGQSRRLIVCCSPSSAASRWVQLEIEAFAKRADAGVLPILVAGAPEDSVAPLFPQRELRYADVRGLLRRGRPRDAARMELVRVIADLVSVDLRTFVPWHLERQRRRRLVLWGAVGAGLAALAVAGAGFVVERQQRELEAQKAQLADDNRRIAERNAQLEARNRRLEGLRRQADAAVAAARSGDAVAAVALLDRLLRDVGDETGFEDHRRLHRHLHGQLVPLAQALAEIPALHLFRWRGVNHLKVDGASVRPLPGPAIAFQARTPDGRHLLTVDVLREVALYSLPQAQRIVGFPLGEAKAVSAHLQADGTLLLVADRLELQSDEEKSDAQDVGARFVTRIDPVQRRHAVIDEQRAQAMGCTAQPQPACPGRLLPPVDAAGTRMLQFPARRPEAAHWVAAGGAGPPPAASLRALIARPLEHQALAFQRAERLSLTRLPSTARDDIRRALTGGDMAPEFFFIDGQEYLQAFNVTGNQYVAWTLCALANPSAVQTCARIDSTARTTPVWSGDRRYFLIHSFEVQPDALRLFSLPLGTKPCQGFEHPAERTASAAFSADGRRLALLSKDDELWVYELDGACGVRLLRRLNHPTLARWRQARERAGGAADVAAAMVFAGQDRLVVAQNPLNLMAFDLGDGTLRWSLAQGALAPRAELGLAASPDGATLLAFDTNAVAAVDGAFGVLLGQREQVLPGPLDSLEGLRAAAVGNDGAVDVACVRAARPCRLLRAAPPAPAELPIERLTGVDPKTALQISELTRLLAPPAR